MRSDSWYDVFLFGIISYHMIWYDITLPNIVSYYLVWHDEIIPSHPLISCLCIILLLLQSLYSLSAFLCSFSLNISSHKSFLSFITLSICLSVCLSAFLSFSHYFLFPHIQTSRPVCSLFGWSGLCSQQQRKWWWLITRDFDFGENYTDAGELGRKKKRRCKGRRTHMSIERRRVEEKRKK